MAITITEHGIANLTPNPEEVAYGKDHEVPTLRLWGESADHAVAAIGHTRRLFVDGVEYEVAQVLLRAV